LFQAQTNDYRAQILASESPDYYGTSQTGFNQALEAAEQFFPEQMTQRQQYDLPQAPGDNLLGGFEYTGGQNLSRFPKDFGPQYTPGGEFVGMTRLPTESPAETLRLQEYAQSLRTPQEVQPSVLDRLRGGLQSAETGYQDFTQNYPMLSRLLTTGVSSLPAVLAARSSRREGRAAADELRALGAPLREEAESLTTTSSYRRSYASTSTARRGTQGFYASSSLNPWCNQWHSAGHD
jgi:hypothetical protein